MKKFQIKIAEPCHENWDAMTQQDKGKFCASCQKTVVDFSTMSDRQIADFFKKPARSVCGRFYSDQLERTIEAPKKRLPWVKYFFNVTWPAMMLFLKSCVEKQPVMGDISFDVSAPKPQEQELYTTMGLVLPQITPEDTLRRLDPGQIQETVCSTVKGEIAVQPEPQLMGDTIIMQVDTIAKELPAIKSYEPMDTINIVGYEKSRMNSLIAGGISIVNVEETKPEPTEQKTTDESSTLLVFPNPVRLGGQLTVKLSTMKEAPKQVQLFSVSGQLITTMQNQWVKENNVRLSIPTWIKPGTYFLRVTTENLSSNTANVLVIN
ncbi:MAG: T9SS type A sorting domain-containing protein [Chitinophagaceae bacterium]|nr:MAG: T9SS type A sorting domain-containing protein [Chitinophagaceae bacterium]